MALQNTGSIQGSEIVKACYYSKKNGVSADTRMYAILTLHLKKSIVYDCIYLIILCKRRNIKTNHRRKINSSSFGFIVFALRHLVALFKVIDSIQHAH